MSVDLAIDVTDRDVIDALDQLLASGKDLRPAMRQISQVLLDNIEEALDNEADPETGAPWQNLAESTIAQRLAKGKWPGKMLQLSQGGLASSFSASYGADFAQAGSNKPYAAIHHFGGLAGRGGKVHIPARPYAGLSPEGRDEVLDILTRHLGL